MRGIFILLALGMTTLAPPAFAAEKKAAKASHAKVKFDFRGLHLGDPKPRVLGDPQAHPSSCTPTGIPEQERCTVFWEHIGDLPVTLVYTFTHGHLSQFQMRFQATDYADLSEAFRGKYGTPDETQTFPLKPFAGVNVVNESLGWDTDAGRLRLVKYGSLLDGGFASIESAEHKKAAQAGAKQKTKKAVSLY
jgi:hypothetical protein